MAVRKPWRCFIGREPVTGSICFAPVCAIVPRQFRVLFKRTFFLTTWSTFQAVISPVLAALCVAILMSMDNDLLEGAKPTVDSVQHTTAAIASLLSALASVPSLYTKVRRHSATGNGGLHLC